jgi:hypothetical protein
MASRTKRGGVGAQSSASFPLASGGGVAVAGRQGGATNRTWQAGSIDRSEEGDARTHARAGGISPPLDFSGDAGVSVLRAWNWAYKPNSSQ